MQFLIIARDGKDADALDRRMKARDAHLEGVKKMHAAGEMLEGGAVLDDEGKMVGSCCIVEFPSREELDAWLGSDPYVTGGVWQEIEVHLFRAAPLGQRR